MAGVDLQGVILAAVTDLSEQLALNAGVEVSASDGSRGDFRPYAGGRVRLVRRTGRSRVVQVTVRRIDRATREQLTDWAGELLLYRDGRGRKVYGAYLEPQFREQPGLPYADVSLTLVEITTSEAV